MNKRIRELAEQAGAVKAKHITNVPGDLVLVGNEEIAKFALLIAEECGDYASWRQENYDDADIGEAIKQHFAIDTDDEVEYCPKCNLPDSGTSCGLNDCGWITGVEE
jgi:hypothetical protein